MQTACHIKYTKALQENLSGKKAVTHREISKLTRNIWQSLISEITNAAYVFFATSVCTLLHNWCFAAHPW